MTLVPILGEWQVRAVFAHFWSPNFPGWRFQSQKQRTLVQLGFIILKHHQPVLGDQQPFFVSHTSQLGSVTLGGMGIEHLCWCLFSSHWWDMLLPRHHSIGSCFSRCSCSYCHNRSLMSPTSDKINTLGANWANSKLLENTTLGQRWKSSHGTFWEIEILRLGCSNQPFW